MKTYVIVLVNGTEVPNPSIVGVNPSNDLKILGPFDSPEVASEWAETTFIKEENFVILPLEWQYETIY